MKRYFFRFVVVSAFLLIESSCHAGTASHDIGFPSNSTGQEYVIGSENVLQIDVYYGKGEKISQKVKVSSRGYISFPLLGEVEVRGLTVSQFQKKLTDLLDRDYLVNPQVSVFVEEYSSVSILGEVLKPGSYPIQGQMSVVQLISKAEGFTKTALQTRVKVIRTGWEGTKQEVFVNVKDVIANKERDVTLQGGDVVAVEKEYNTVSILGQVERPGSYPIEGNMTVTQLIAVAGGFTKIAAPNKVRIIRTGDDGIKQEIPAKVKDIMDNREQDISLRMGDMVVVAESFF